MVKVELDMRAPTPVESHVLNLNTDEIWHQRFCHTSYDTIKKVAELNKVRGLHNTKETRYVWDACCVGKATKAPMQKAKGEAGEPGM